MTRTTHRQDEVLDAASRPVNDPARSVTGAPSAQAPASGGLEAQLQSLPSPVRLQMQLIARAAKTPDDALAPIISLLVDGSVQKREAIITAFRTHDALRDQWLRTWEILRS